jgi:Gpi18-like mannosyltransferase
MHERYFYLADVISLIYAFYFPDYFYVVILIQISSLLSYISFLMGMINLQYVALLPLGLIAVATWDLLKTLYSPPQDGVD